MDTTEDLVTPSAQGDGDPTTAFPPEPPGFRPDTGDVQIPPHLLGGALVPTLTNYEGAAVPAITSFGIVRYVTAGEVFRPALIVDVEGDLVTLAVFHPGAPHIEPQHHVPYDHLGKTPHSWH